MSLLVVGIVRRARHPYIRLLGLTAVFIWTTAEAMSWFVAAARLDEMLNPVVVIEAVVTLAVSIGSLTLLARTARPLPRVPLST
ncbi:hypothetical protein Q7L65_23720 [Conexibacter sp. CPCC 206217]|nr:hypothetical protein [Conexibacter sp. CPCC 206217]